MEAYRRGTENNALMKRGTRRTAPLLPLPTAVRKPITENVALPANLVDVRTIHSAMTHKGTALCAQAKRFQRPHAALTVRQRRLRQPIRRVWRMEAFPPITDRLQCHNKRPLTEAAITAPAPCRSKNQV
jgi:hypothetical protein